MLSPPFKYITIRRRKRSYPRLVEHGCWPGNASITGGGGWEMEPKSMEKLFEGTMMPSWREQLTVRAFIVSFILGSAFCVIVMKLNYSSGIIPSLNVSSRFLGFFFIKTWVKFVSKSGLARQPFTHEENTCHSNMRCCHFWHHLLWRFWFLSLCHNWNGWQAKRHPQWFQQHQESTFGMYDRIHVCHQLSWAFLFGASQKGT